MALKAWALVEMLKTKNIWKFVLLEMLETKKKHIGIGQNSWNYKVTPMESNPPGA